MKYNVLNPVKVYNVSFVSDYTKLARVEVFSIELLATKEEKILFYANVIKTIDRIYMNNMYTIGGFKVSIVADRSFIATNYISFNYDNYCYKDLALELASLL